MSKGTGLTVKAQPSNQITAEQFKAVLPKSIQGTVTVTLLDSINKLMSDSTLRENYRDNLLGYTQILSEGKWKLQSYIDAVRYVSFKMMGVTNLDAYIKAFPDRYQRMINEKLSDNHISGVISMFSKTKLVNKILEQTLIPVHVFNADLHQKAINQLAHLMINARSEFVQSNSAAKLVDALAVPEVQTVELGIKVTEDSAITELRKATLELVQQQHDSIVAKKKSAQDIAHTKIVRGTPGEITDGNIVP